jgi:O-antigen/teichoic acid export membrane protein
MATNQHNKISIAFILSAATGLVSSTLVIPYLGIDGVGIMLVLSEIPLLFITINSALKLLNDSWFKYLKTVLGNPIKNYT